MCFSWSFEVEIDIDIYAILREFFKAKVLDQLGPQPSMYLHYSDGQKSFVWNTEFHLKYFLGGNIFAFDLRV